MQAPPQLPGVRVAPPVSMQEQITMRRQQQIPINATAPMTLVLPTSSVIRSIPVSLSGSDSKSLHSSAVMSSDISKELIIVDSHTGLVQHKESQSAQSQSQINQSQTNQSQTNQSQTDQSETNQTNQAQSVNENVYRLSEVVLKEREALFRDGDSDAVYVLEPPREGLQTVRMRSKNFFTVMEESDDESEGKKVVKQDQDKQLKTNFPLYTPVFNVGQSLHHIFHQAGKHKRRNKGQAVDKADGTADAADDSDVQIIPTHNSHREYDSDPGQCQHWHEKIAMTSGMRKNRSQPNLETLSVEEFIEREMGVIASSKSLPVTPGVSPKPIRRNSLNNMSMESLKPEIRKPDPAGPGLSFLASVAGELRSYKKRYNPKGDTQVAEYKQNNLTVDFQRSGSAEIPKRPSSTSSVDSSPGASPKRNTIAMEMQANDLLKAGKPKKSFFKSVMDWSTTKQPVGNKETNMFSPTSF